MFQVEMIPNGFIYTVYGIETTSQMTPMFLIFAGNAWVWLPASKFKPIG